MKRLTVTYTYLDGDPNKARVSLQQSSDGHAGTRWKVKINPQEPRQVALQCLGEGTSTWLSRTRNAAWDPTLTSFPRCRILIVSGGWKPLTRAKGIPRSSAIMHFLLAMLMPHQNTWMGTPAIILPGAIKSSCRGRVAAPRGPRGKSWRRSELERTRGQEPEGELVSVQFSAGGAATIIRLPDPMPGIAPTPSGGVRRRRRPTTRTPGRRGLRKPVYS